MSGRRKKTEKDDDEVEELLRAAEDSMLLKLSLNSHLSRAASSSTPIDPDLDRRFQALRSKPTPSKSNPNPPSSLPNPPPSLPTDLDPHQKPQEDDLLARFAALKSSIPAYSSSSLNEQHKIGNGDDEEDDDDEVEKLIRWAVDAARLDPSPPSDIDDDAYHSNTDDTDNSTDEDVDERVTSKKKKKNGKPK